MKKRFFLIFIIIVVILAIFFAFYFSMINPVIIDSTRLSLDSIAKKAINKGVDNVANSRAVYNDLVNISYNDIGHISLIQIKTYEASKICNEIVESTENAIYEYGNAGFKIKAGVFSGIPLFSGIGKDITFYFRQIGAVSCTYHSKFVTAGINQNLHRLYVDIDTSLSVILPFHTEVVNVSQTVLLCENVIIGDIPYTYLQSTELDPLLNLIPS